MNVDQFPGIELALNTMPSNGVILVFTDAGTKMRELEDAIKKKSKEKNIKIFIAFTPECTSEKYCSRSMPSYESVSEGRIFNHADFDSEKFFKSVIYTVGNLFIICVLFDFLEFKNFYIQLLKPLRSCFKLFCCTGKKSMSKHKYRNRNFRNRNFRK